MSKCILSDEENQHWCLMLLLLMSLLYIHVDVDVDVHEEIGSNFKKRYTLVFCIIVPKK